jgi:hypothetical protein
MNQLSAEEQIKAISALIDNNAKTKILFILPESAGDIFLSTSLLESLKELYPDSDIYYACKEAYHSILYKNPYIYKTIPYYQIMDNQIAMEGTGDWRGVFDISIMASIFTQRFLNYLNNGKGKIAFNLKK